MGFYRKRPVIVEAVKLTRKMTIETPEGTMRGKVGDWLITGINGEHYPCSDDVFQQTYEPYVRLENDILRDSTDAPVNVPS